MNETDRITIPTQRGREVQSLCWQGDELVDWVSGGVRYRLDGTTAAAPVIFAYRFDGAVASPDGRYAVIYERLGTKGLILKEGKILREINRSFYHASAYEYPVALLSLPDGRDAIAHCPDEYNKIEIEEIESVDCLTSREGAPLDFFHSRLQISPNGRLLLSAGWIWHPLDMIQVYDIERTLQEPAVLDANDHGHAVLIEDMDPMDEIHSAAFTDDESIVVAGGNYYDSEDETHFLGIYRVSENRLTTRVPLEEAAGALMPMGDLVVSFFAHPKLIELSTGRVVYRWAGTNTGRQNSSITSDKDQVPPIARDPRNRRFAVAGSDSIEVIRLG